MSRNDLDPVTLEILWTRLVSAVDEASAAFVRTSFSTLVREANDFAVVLTDKEGRSVAQSSMSIPSFIGTLPATVKHFIRHFPPETLAPGDVLITNDPWMGTGHIHDITVVMPIFRDGSIHGYAAVTSHMPDIGGRLRSSGTREIFEEGLQIPMLKLVRAGVVDDTVVAFISQNVRVPEQTMGDVWGEVAACRMLEGRLNELLDDSGLDLDRLSGEIRGRSEAAMRAAVAALPDGDYRYRLEHDGFEERIVIQNRVEIRGDRVHIDYTGTSEQLPRSVNTVPIYTFAYTAFGVKALLSPDIPNNEGSFLPISTSAPEGTILNPRYPAASGARGMIGHLLPVAFMAALADVLPDRVMAPGSANSSFTMAGEDEGRRYATANFLNAGQGAFADRDGLSVVSFPSNLGNTPIEVIEAGAPVRVLHRAVRPGSGGGGAHRGGDGLDFAFEFVGDTPAVCSFLMTRLKAAPPGLAGGDPGVVGRLTLNGTDIDPADHWILKKGDRVVMQTAGGGGYGKA
ncbi:hydantoinase B/oxoprolinase family protein [Acuticoccus mangrovi]|uniref:Hydantoinase B/oxoprolinase family protein n=1 Tax=Acuticoccus mangrovi TaxID=2796142 RepID=A0A934MCU6_9HYPH|nr:hydantoinase B/oxoprolinase family protein [Acuticoccus mangrovi]MBJ3775647.1 hydantoinase B/oxoprolinase family protein [Acuticoccus mangrovi]